MKTKANIRLLCFIGLFWSLAYQVDATAPYVRQDSHWVSLDTTLFDLDVYRSDPAYTYTRSKDEESKLRRWFRSVLRRWFAAERRSSFTTGDILVWFIVLAALGGIGYFVYTQRWAPRVEQHQSLDMAEEIKTRTEADVQARLDRAIRSGDSKQAIRYLLMASLQHLDQTNLIRYRSDETNHQLLRQLRSKPEWSAYLREVMGAYEQVWFGHYELSTSEVGRMKDAYVHMKSHRG